MARAVLGQEVPSWPLIFHPCRCSAPISGSLVILLTAGLWVTWGWGGLKWDKLLAGITGSTVASLYQRPQTFYL